MFSDEDLDKLVFDGARHLPTPASFGELQILTPIEESFLSYTQEWLKDSKKIENELAVWNDYRLWLIKNEQDLFDDISRQYMKEKLIILKKQKDAFLSKVAVDKSFNVSNGQVIGGGAVSS